MYKIVILALREYKASVKTKGFIIGLVVVPVLMMGGLFTYSIFGDKVDINSKNIAVIDHTGKILPAIEEAANFYNETQVFDTSSGKQLRPKYIIESVAKNSEDEKAQMITLSKRVKNKEIHAFVIIGENVIHPSQEGNSIVNYYSENSFMDDIRTWLRGIINDKVRQLRVADLGLEQEQVATLFSWIDVKGLGLIEVNDSGEVLKNARESNMTESFFIPYILMMLMFMMIMMSATPLLYSVMEEKTDRIAEVLLGSLTPFQFMMGKVLGGVSVALTGAVVYIIGGVIAATQLGYADMIPMDIIPWFFAYLILSILMMGTVMASLGSASNDTKDAQNLQFPAIIPLIIPMMVMFPVIKEPLSSFATGMSLFPPFTPFLMLIRLASPASIPMWQPMVGLLGILLFTALSIWLGGKVFRTMILMQGKRPKFGSLFRMLMKK